MGLLSVCRFRDRVLSLLLLTVGFCTHAFAGTTTIAITGADATGVVGAQFNSISLGEFNGNGQIVFGANLEIGVGGVTSDDDDGLWFFDGADLSLVAREGSASVPGVLGANFQSFASMAIDSSGDLAFRAELKTGVGGVTTDSNQGTWRYSSGVGALIARTGSEGVPDVSGADFSTLPTTLALADDGHLVHHGMMRSGVGGASSNNDRGVWSYPQDVASSLIARESTSSVPGVPGGTFNVFGAPSINSDDQIAFIASLKLAGGVSAENSTGIWQYDSAVGTLVARTGVGNVPDVSGPNFATFGSPTQNNSGQLALRATLDVPADRGIWGYTEGVGQVLARSGVAGVPGVAGADFLDFDDPRINDAGRVLVRADLEIGPGGVTADDDQGLWLLEDGGTLVVRTGSGGVPEVVGANFEEISAYALGDDGQVAIAALLEAGVGGVDTSNDGGIWVFDSDGVSRMVAREGSLLAGRTVASLELLDGAATGRPNGPNDLGQFAFQATFDNGDSGLFLSSRLDADFDYDNDVDTSDLLRWESGFGTSNGALHTDGDADRDLDVDGNDFLIWQQQYTGGSSPIGAISSVPEPKNAWVLGIGVFWIWIGKRRPL